MGKSRCKAHCVTQCSAACSESGWKPWAASFPIYCGRWGKGGESSRPGKSSLAGPQRCWLSFGLRLYRAPKLVRADQHFHCFPFQASRKIENLISWLQIQIDNEEERMRKGRGRGPLPNLPPPCTGPPSESNPKRRAGNAAAWSGLTIFTPFSTSGWWGLHGFYCSFPRSHFRFRSRP